MRKNGVIRGIERIEGGVCAPKGFTACGASGENGWNYAAVKSEKRATAAYASECGAIKSSFLTFNEGKRKDLLRVVSVASGYVDMGAGETARYAKELCLLSVKAFAVPETDILPLFVGKVGVPSKQPDIAPAFKGMKPSVDGSSLAARAIAGKGEYKEFACSFYIGDVVCRIGFIGRGATFSEPACISAVITTDVAISAPLLQKALDAEMKDGFGSLVLSDLPSPMDAVCVMANGEAENAPICQADSDYEKFADAFHLAVVEICKLLATRTREDRFLSCIVKGAKSKQAAREIAKSVLRSETVKESVKKGKIDAIAVLYAVGHAAVPIEPQKVRLSVSSEFGSVQIVEEGQTTVCSAVKLKKILSAKEICLKAELKSGNYSATTLTTLRKE